MKTLKNPTYLFKRQGLTTTCTMQIDLQHITELLNPAQFIYIGSTKVIHSTDEDNQEVANKYAKRKAFKMACHIVATAINRVLEHRARETEKLENIAIKLQVMSKH